MRLLLTFVLIGCLIGSMMPLEAATHEKVPQYARVHRLVRAADAYVQEMEAFLASDSGRQELRIELEGTQVAIPYGAVLALHYERSVDPSKWGWPLKDTKHFLVIHYVDLGQPSAEVVRLSKDDVDRMLRTIETEMHVTVDRNDAKHSFLAIPIRATIGDLVVVTDVIGQEHEGRITRLTSTSLELDGSSFTPRVFDQSTVRSIRRPRPRRQEMTVGFAAGAAAGAIMGGLLGAGLGGGGRAVFQGAAIMGTMTGGIGLAVAAVGSSYRHRATRDIYLGR